MSLWTDFRDSAVKAVVPEKYQAIDASQLGQLAGDGLVKIASSAPGGNQTAAEVAKGQYGSPSQGLSPVQVGGMVLSIPVLIAIGAGIYFLSRRK